MSIHILPPEVASQIAAGEVVERPASVVKELLENALDAGARAVTIAVEGGGRRLIEVADDGAGIPAGELPLAVARHATSKLSSATDLFRIATLGFRGEALASIGSVARLSLASRVAEAPAGARLSVIGGQAGALETVGAPVGTLVRVEDLFFNVPARLKFLRSEAAERRQIDELVTRYALAYPQVRFQLRQEGRLALQTSGNGDRREILAALFGLEVSRQLLEVLAEFEFPTPAQPVGLGHPPEPASELLRISGFISPLAVTRSNRRELHFFVNGRWVQDVALATALLQAYHTLLMVGRYPLATLFLEMPPARVDVNVHPAKAEVRFRERDWVFSSVQRAVRRALLAHSPLPSLAAPAFADPALLPGAPASADEYERQSFDLAAFTQPEAAAAAGLSPQARLPQEPALSAPEMQEPVQPRVAASLLRLVGQVAAAYLVAEGPDGLYLVDQHAAHERVLFERFLAQRRDPVPAQTLLSPATVELTPAGARLLAEQLPLLARLGFQVEGFGGNTFLVRAIPSLLGEIDPAAALRVLVEDFEEDEQPLQAEMEARLIARVCKRAAVKAGQLLSGEEQRALLRDLEACQAPRTCPHGRPTMIHLSVDLLERQFGRRGAR
jgi:DNA mismatch repair protein MutL